MNIAEEITFDKDGYPPAGGERFPWVKKLYLSLVIILVAGLAFGLGKLSVVGEKADIRIDYNPEIFNSQFPISNIENSASVVASKNSSKYHYPHCSGAKQIAEANKITFESPAAAEASGYTLASNCRKP